MKKKLFDWLDGLTLVSNQGQPPIFSRKRKRNSEREKEVIDLRIFLSTLNGFVSSISGLKLERTKAKLCLSGLDSIDRFVKEKKIVPLPHSPI